MTTKRRYLLDMVVVTTLLMTLNIWNADEWQTPRCGDAIYFCKRNKLRYSLDRVRSFFRLNGYGTTPLTPCEEKMKEAVADVGVFVNVTHRLGETIGMDAGGDCQRGRYQSCRALSNENPRHQIIACYVKRVH